jgi:hypothetical protein
MFVHSVKAIEGEKSNIAASLVRFYDISDYQSEIGSNSLYKSVFTGIYEGFPVILQREVCEGRIVLSPRDDNGAGDKIKGCAEIMDDVADDWGNTFGISGRALYQELVALAAGCRILVGAGGIRVDFDKISEPSFKLIDVLVGPFDL